MHGTTTELARDHRVVFREADIAFGRFWLFILSGHLGNFDFIA
jgi:hypothetical protein